MGEEKKTLTLFLIFLLIGVVMAISLIKPVKEKIAREEAQTEAIEDIGFMKVQISQLQDAVSTRATIEYVTNNDNRVYNQVKQDAINDVIEIQRYNPTADCIEVEMETPNKIRLDCIRR